MAGVEIAGSFAASLPDSCADTWRRATRHPFVTAVADGSLATGRFNVWIQQDNRFVEGLTRFIRELTAIAPEEDAAGLEAGLAALGAELELFEGYASREGIRLDVPALDMCASYVAFLRGLVGDDYSAALTAYYGCERAYLEAWTGVRARTGATGPYADWIENWTSEAFAAYVDWLGARLDVLAAGAGDDVKTRLVRVFERTVEFEVAFWDACLA